MRITRSMTLAERRKKRENEDAQRDMRSDELLPNISNDITLQVICAKLLWATFRTLSLVSPNWHRAIRRGDFFAGRAASNSGEKFAVVNRTVSRGKFGLSLYSLGDGPKWPEALPPIPRVKTGIPQSCECITWYGKLYILGGLKDQRTQLGSQNVYMLNLQSGFRQWKKCASMLSPRHKFRAGILHGKIYVCGGSSRRTPVCGTEVYDPEADAWTQLMPMPFPRTGHDAEVVDGELFVYGGRFFHEDFQASQANFRSARPREVQALDDSPDTIPEEHYTYRANHIDIYNPVQDNWRRVLLDIPAVIPEKPDERDSTKLLFIARGRLHFLSDNEISAFDFQERSWNSLCSISTRLIGRRYNPNISHRVRAIQVLDGEVYLVAAHWYVERQHLGLFLRLSLPFGLHHGAQADRKNLEWTLIDDDLSFKGGISRFIRLLKL